MFDITFSSFTIGSEEIGKISLTTLCRFAFIIGLKDEVLPRFYLDRGTIYLRKFYLDSSLRISGDIDLLFPLGFGGGGRISILGTDDFLYSLESLGFEPYKFEVFFGCDLNRDVCLVPLRCFIEALLFLEADFYLCFPFFFVIC